MDRPELTLGDVGGRGSGVPAQAMARTAVSMPAANKAAGAGRKTTPSRIKCSVVRDARAA